MIRSGRGLVFVVVAGLVQPMVPLGAQGIDALAMGEINQARPGMVVAVSEGGRVQYLEPFGNAREDPPDPMAADQLFAFPGLTQVLIGATVEALDAAGALDAEAPIRLHLDGLSPRLGRVTLRQLITSTSGLDDAVRVEGDSWEKTLDRLNDGALVAEPGALYSRSKHTFPLAARVLAKAVGRPLVEILQAAILEPLGLTASTFDLAVARARGVVEGVEITLGGAEPLQSVEPADTLDGLPVLFTTAGDVVKLLSALTEGRFSGGTPDGWAEAALPFTDGERRYGAGMWVDRYRGLTRVRHVSTELGMATTFTLFPESGSIVFVWSRGQPSTKAEPFVVATVARLHAGTAEVDSDSVRTLDLPAADPPSPDPGRWAGNYRNGHQIFDLRSTDGRLTMFNGSSGLDVRWIGEGWAAAFLPDGRMATRFHLWEDDGGRRFLYHGDLAYRHQEDRLGS